MEEQSPGGQGGLTPTTDERCVSVNPPLTQMVGEAVDRRARCHSVFTGPAGASSLSTGVCAQNSALGGVAGLTRQAGQDQEREVSMLPRVYLHLTVTTLKLTEKGWIYGETQVAVINEALLASAQCRGRPCRALPPSSKPVPVSGSQR